MLVRDLSLFLTEGILKTYLIELFYSVLDMSLQQNIKKTSIISPMPNKPGKFENMKTLNVRLLILVRQISPSTNPLPPSHT